MFDQFTGQARKALEFAYREAQAAPSDYLGTEHVLLGLCGEPSGFLERLLQDLKVDPEKLRLRARMELAQEAALSPLEISRLPLTPGARRALLVSLNAAGSDHQPLAGSAHLLVGLLRQEDSQAAKVLNYFGITLTAVQESLAKISPQENRDFQVQPEVQPGSARATDPSAEELAQLIAWECYSPHDAGVGRPSKYLLGSLDVQTLHSKIQMTAMAAGFATGLVVGILDWPLGMYWPLVGLLCGSTRTPAPGLAFGICAGIRAALLVPWAFSFVFVILGAFLGLFIGDGWNTWIRVNLTRPRPYSLIWSPWVFLFLLVCILVAGRMVFLSPEQMHQGFRIKKP